MAKCHNCHGDLDQNGFCYTCGVGPRIGPASPDDAVPVGGIPDPNGFQMPKCPTCGETFDGWDCRACGFALPEKARKMQPKVVDISELPPDLQEILRKKTGDLA